MITEVKLINKFNLMKLNNRKTLYTKLIKKNNEYFQIMEKKNFFK